MTEARPAFYALAPGGWRDYVTLLHLPYTAWHLSFVVIGAALAPELHEGRLGAALLAFFLALGVAAHALDELNGHPLATRIPDGVLRGLTVTVARCAPSRSESPVRSRSISGCWPSSRSEPRLCPPTASSSSAARSTTASASLSPGALSRSSPATSPARGRSRWVALLAAGYATLASYAQRTLSTPVRHARRRVAAVAGTVELHDGTREPVTTELLYGSQERALQLLAAANVCLAVALLVLRLT